ncbi:hypothetical protein ACFY3M_40460 [Streptomyces mirabilis]|uniref:hypothetical protein n=1 Tax=Streptomyces mirabilis TaxID=68239 RepID=UPI0036BA44E8
MSAVTATLPRIWPSPGGKPLPSTGMAEVFRAFARDLAAGRRSWDADTARFIAGQFDEPAVEWDTSRATGRDDPLRDALDRGGPFPDGSLYVAADDVAAALPGQWHAVEAQVGWGSWAVLRRV